MYLYKFKNTAVTDCEQYIFCKNNEEADIVAKLLNDNAKYIYRLVIGCSQDIAAKALNSSDIINLSKI